MMPAMASSGQGPVSLNAQLLVDSIPALIHTARPDGYLDYFNKPWLEYLGVTLDKVTGWNWTAVVHPEDVEGIVAKWRACLATGEVFEYETRVRSANGEYRWMFHRKVPLRDANGNIVKWYGSSLDIEERKTAEEKLRRSERDLHSIIETIPTMVWSAAPDGSVDFFNPRWRDYTGLSPDQSRDWRWTAAIQPDDLSRLTDAWQSILVSGEPGETEARLRRFDGAYRWFLFRANPLRDESGNIVKWYGINFDIEDRKRAEEGLRTSESYLAEAQRLSHTGSWAWSPQQDIRYWSEECYRVLSFDPQDGLPRFEDFFQRIHPDDQPGFRELIQTAIREKAEWEADYRIAHPDGAIRDIHVVSHPVLSASGHLVEFVGTVIDVTERKRAEEELRRSEMELQQMLDLAPQQVAVFGPGGERLYGNRVAREYTGLTLEEYRSVDVIGRVIHPDDTERMRNIREHGLSANNPFEIEARTLGKDGVCRWFLYRYNPLRDNRGQITRWYVTGTDVDDRKQAEDRLRSENVALREEIDKASMFEEIVGTSPALKSVLSRISKVAPSDSTVLITGDTGTGKELVARAIHRRSGRVSRAFVSVNCAAIPP